MLLVEADDHLRLDCAIAKPRHDSLLNVWQSTRSGRNFARIRNVDAALLVDSLRWQIDEITWAGTGSLRRRKQATRRGLEDRNVQHIADASDLLWFWSLVGKCPRKGDKVRLGQQPDRVGTHIHQSIW